MRLPFAIHHIAIMPDAHVGYGMPIGAILATKDVVVVNAVGVDIGCGMLASRLIDVPELEKRLPEIRHKIMQRVPRGFKKHETPRDDANLPDLPHSHLVRSQAVNAMLQLGTLGGGNHFIEIQRAKDGGVWVMIHSGSRNLGKQVCDYYNAWAKDDNIANFSRVDPKWDLAFFHQTHNGFKEYMADMNFCIAYAERNRRLMLHSVVEVFREFWPDMTFVSAIDICHNSAAIENHYRQNMIIHRKGAAGPLRKNYGIIPGSMGTPSYIVRGRGSAAAYFSTSHGAGRRMGRKEAQRALSLAEQQAKMGGIAHGLATLCQLDEAPDAYKDIHIVMNRQTDLCETLAELTPLASIKG